VSAKTEFDGLPAEPLKACLGYNAPAELTASGILSHPLLVKWSFVASGSGIQSH
jgi:hypothetical protein